MLMQHSRSAASACSRCKPRRLGAAAVYLGLDRCGLLEAISFILVSSRVAFPDGFAPGAGDNQALQLTLNMQLVEERGCNCAMVLLRFTEQIQF